MTSLRQRMIEDMQIRNLSMHTQTSYVQQVSLFARHFNKSPELLGPEEIRDYQVYLTNKRELATSSILIAVSALRFLYKVTLIHPAAGERMAREQPALEFLYREIDRLSIGIDKEALRARGRAARALSRQRN